MDDKRFHAQIEAQQAEKKSEIWDSIQQNLPPVAVAAPQKRTAAPKRRRWFRMGIAAACLCAVCLAVVLPVALHFMNADTGRFSSSTDYSYQEVNYTVREYAQTTGKNILHLPRYETADSVSTTLYTDKKDASDMICLEEVITDNMGATVTYYITDTRTTVDFLTTYFDICTNTSAREKVTVKWYYLDQTMDPISFAYFEYSGYRYFINEFYPADKESILRVVDEFFA